MSGSLTIEDHRSVRMLVVLVVVVVVVVHGAVVRMGMLANWRCRLHPEAETPVEILRQAPHDAHVHADAHGGSFKKSFSEFYPPADAELFT